MGEFFVARQHEMTPDFSDLLRSVQQLEGHYRQLLKVAGPALRAIKNDPAVAQIVQMAPTILAEAERSKPFIQDLSRQMEVAADLLSANKEAFFFAAAFAHRYLDSVSSRAALGSLERAELHTLVDAAVHDLGERTEDRQEALAEALSAEPRSSATDGQHQQGRLSLLVAVLSFLVASYAAYQNQQSGDEQQIHSQRQIALLTQINEHIRQHLDQTPEVARSYEPSATTIVIRANTIPVAYDQRRRIEDAVRDILEGLPGQWEVWLEEPQDASLYRIEIRGAGDYRNVWAFDGPDEQDPDFITSALRRDLPKP